ncbi:MAG: AAA family ATPase, partial [Deltaproteobacteria bacterium]
EVKAKAILRKIIDECHRIAEMAFEPGIKTQEVLNSFQTSALGMDGRSSMGSTVKELAKRHVNKIESAWKNQKPLLGISTGFKKLDSQTLGWQSPDLIIIAARPSRGKTALALDLAKAAARSGHKVYFASLEMSAEQLVMRLLSGECGISGRALRCGQFPEGDWSRIVIASGRLAELEIIIDDTSAISELELARRVRRVKPALLVVDYLQLMRSAQKADRKDLEIANITGCLKALAKEVNIPVILLSQLNREVEKRRDGWLQLSDLRDSGAIEQDADLVLGIRRDPDKTPESADLICLKHRNGPLGTIKLVFREELASFGDLAQE